MEIVRKAHQINVVTPSGILQLAKGNGKIGNMLCSPSTDPHVTCPSVCDYCYALRRMHQYPQTRNRWRENTRVQGELLASDPDAYAEALHDALAYWHDLHPSKNRLFRWHVSGDFVSQDHVEIAADLARQFPSVLFYSYTKRDWVPERRPGNLGWLKSLQNVLPYVDPASELEIETHVRDQGFTGFSAIVTRKEEANCLHSLNKKISCADCLRCPKGHSVKILLHQ